MSIDLETVVIVVQSRLNLSSDALEDIRFAIGDILDEFHINSHRTFDVHIVQTSSPCCAIHVTDLGSLVRDDIRTSGILTQEELVEQWDGQETSP